MKICKAAGTVAAGPLTLTDATRLGSRTPVATDAGTDAQDDTDDFGAAAGLLPRSRVQDSNLLLPLTRRLLFPMSYRGVARCF